MQHKKWQFLLVAVALCPTLPFSIIAITFDGQCSSFHKVIVRACLCCSCLLTVDVRHRVVIVGLLSRTCTCLVRPTNKQSECLLFVVFFDPFSLALSFALLSLSGFDCFLLLLVLLLCWLVSLGPAQSVSESAWWPCRRR